MELTVLRAAPTRPTTRAGAWKLVSSRVAPAVIFLVLDVMVARTVVGDVLVAANRALTLRELFILVGVVLYLAFVSLMILLFLIRPPAQSQDARFSSWVLAMTGTFGLVVAPLLPPGPVLFHTGALGELIRSLVIVVATALALTTLQTLGQAFSLTPQARELVSRGPYRLVRHPLYLCESLAILCLVVGSGELTLILVAVLVFAAQVRRAQLEEQVLRAAFPDYDDVFRGVPHFLPFIY